MHGVAQGRVLRVAERDEGRFAVSAGAQTLDVEAGTGLVKVELRSLAAVRARDDAEVARFEETVAEGTVAQARRLAAVASRAALGDEGEAARAWHRQLGWHVFFFDEKTPKITAPVLNSTLRLRHTPKTWSGI